LQVCSQNEVNISGAVVALDIEQPSYKSFGRQRAERFGFDVEVLYIAQRLGYRTLEVPVRWNDVAGTKVKMLGALAAFLDPIKVRWNGITGKYRQK